MLPKLHQDCKIFKTNIQLNILNYYIFKNTKYFTISLKFGGDEYVSVHSLDDLL